MKGYQPKNTLSNNKWAVKNFSEWPNAQNKILASEKQQSPEQVLLCDNARVHVEWLSAFVKQTHKADGGEYTPKSLYLLLAGLAGGMRIKKGRSAAFNIFSDPSFELFRNVCEYEFRRLHQKGVGTEVQHTEGISKDDESKFWSSGMLNTDTPTGLLNCVFFYNGKKLLFTWRGGV